MNIRMQRSLRIAVVLGLVAVLALPAGGAGAAKRKRNDRCGGRWDAAASCTLRYKGGGLGLSGSFRSEDIGYISLSLEAIDPVSGVRMRVLNCTFAGTAFGGCASAATGSATIELEPGQKLFCNVQGAERGRFKCSSSRS